MNDPLVREALGAVLREARVDASRTLRDVSAEAGVSLGYLSEIERGHKEASSELLASVCAALDVPVSDVLRGVADRMDGLAAVTTLHPSATAVAA